MKKIIYTCILSVCLLAVLSSAVTMFARDIGDTDKCKYLPFDYDCTPHGRVAGPDVTRDNRIPSRQPIFEHLTIRNRTGVITVTVTSPMDQYWRAKHRSPNWEANETIETADDFLFEEFRIDLRSVAQPIWTSSGSTSTAILNNAVSRHGRTYQGNRTADIMIAFSANPNAVAFINGRWQRIMGQVTDIPSRYAIVFCFYRDENVLTTQHELGHMYGLSHCSVSDCLMNANPNVQNSMDNLCNACTSLWNAARAMYGR